MGWGHPGDGSPLTTVRAALLTGDAGRNEGPERARWPRGKEGQSGVTAKASGFHQAERGGPFRIGSKRPCLRPCLRMTTSPVTWGTD